MSEDIVVPSVKPLDKNMVLTFTYPGKIVLIPDADSVQLATDDSVPEPPKGITDDKVEELEERRMSDDGDGWIIDED